MADENDDMKSGHRANFIYGTFLLVLIGLKLWWFAGGWPIRNWLDDLSDRFAYVFWPIVGLWGGTIAFRARHRSPPSRQEFIIGILLASIAGFVLMLEIVQPFLF